MELLQLRERKIFETLKAIRNLKFAVIGGYAANAYALPRFSVDCDIVIEDNASLDKIERALKKIGYEKIGADKINAIYGGNFARYEKRLEHNFKVSMDVLVENVLDRQTNANFSAAWVFEHSSLQVLKGKTITESIKLHIINPDSLVVMKMASCRSTDIRDVFMLIPSVKDKAWIKEEVAKRCNFNERLRKIKEKITSSEFKDNLQGVYGFVDNAVFEKHKKMLLAMENK